MGQKTVDQKTKEQSQEIPSSTTDEIKSRKVNRENTPSPQKSELGFFQKHAFLGHYEEAPGYMKDSQFIKQGYRINYNNSKELFKSFFQWHNESVNIWTHFFGALLVIVSVIYLSIHWNDADFKTFRQNFSSTIEKQMEPIIDQITNLSSMSIKEKVSDLNINIKTHYNTILSEINSFNDNISLENFQDQYQEILEKIKSKVHDFDLKMIEQLKERLLLQWDELQSDSVNKFDSNQYNWMELDFSNSDLRRNPNQKVPHRWPIVIFLISAALCLLFSSVFHLVYCYSAQINKIFLRLDYAGVSILVSGSAFPYTYYGLYCEPFFMCLYLVVISISSLIVFFISLKDFIHTAPYLKKKSMMYASLGIFSAFPILHLMYNEYESKDGYSSLLSLPYFILMGICYLGGLAIYTLRCPEKYAPGQFDQCGSSHQIWHCSILFAIVFTYIGGIICYHVRYQNQCP